MLLLTSPAVAGTMLLTSAPDLYSHQTRTLQHRTITRVECYQ